MRLSLWVHTPLVLYYLCRELRRECGFSTELLSLPSLKLRLSRLYDAIDWQARAPCAHRVRIVCAWGMVLGVCMGCAWGVRGVCTGYEAIICGAPTERGYR